jgi:hypothetical protein
MRVLPGRHTVEAADRGGRYRRAGWIDAAPDKPARLEVHTEAEVVATPSTEARRRELRAGILAARSRLDRCTRQIEKQGVTDIHVQIDIGVTASGDVSFMNPVDSDVGTATTECVMDVLRDVRFGHGSEATWREKIDL